MAAGYRAAMVGRNGFLLILLGAIFGASFLFMRVAAPILGPVVVAEGRVLVASVVLLVVAGRRVLPELRASWKAYAFLGLVNTALPFALISFAELQINASLASLLNAATPLSTTIVVAIWMRQGLTPRRLLAIVVGFVGVGVLVGWSPIELTPATLVAVLASLGATVGYAVGLTYSRRRFGGVSPLTVAIGQLVAASVILAPPALATLPATAPTLEAILALLALGTLCTALAWPLLFRLLAAVGPTASSTVTFLVPVFGVTWGALFLGEPLAPGTFAGAALVFVSLGLIFDVRLARVLTRSTANA